jgi:hypothetical protein
MTNEYLAAFALIDVVEVIQLLEANAAIYGRFIENMVERLFPNFDA